MKPFLNAAIPAQCFDTNPLLRDLEVTDFADDAVPEIASQSYRGRFTQNMPDLVNFYQPADYATAGSWEFNNRIFKPVKNSGTWLLLGEIETEYKYLPGDRLIFDDLANVRTVISPYEAMPMINQTKTRALGAEGRTDGSILRKVDMSGPDYNFETEHEAVFKFRCFRTWKFYNRLLSEFQPPSQP